MNHKLLLIVVAAALAAGCSKRDPGEGAAQPPAEPPPATATEPAPAAEPPVVESVDAGALTPGEPEADCNAEAAKQFIGQVYSAELGEQARVATGARVERALRPGQIVTMEFLADRLTLTLDEGARISSVNCG